jgi:DNA-binding NarL/FixJ family response regulator
MKAPVIFVVDKNPIHRNLIKYYLNINKFTHVHTFPSGEECLYRLRKNANPEFIISSFFTGSHTGFDFLQIVLDISPSSRVIFFDTFEDPEIAEKLLDIGAADYVVKTRHSDIGISELLKNVLYLARDQALTCDNFS